VRRGSRFRPRALAAPLVAALALLAGGCGSTAAHSAGSTTASTQTRSTDTAPPPGQGHPSVVIGDKNTPEQFVLGELYEQALAAQGFSVSLNRNIGPVGVTIRALHQGSLGMYPEYIDVWNRQVAHDKRVFKSSHAAYQAGQQYATRHGFQLLDPTPFGNTEALAVTDYYAAQHNLRRVVDLRALGRPLVVGGPPQFKASGLSQLERVYRFRATGFKILPVGSQYQALAQNSVQAAAVNTTDGDLATGDYRVLQDPKHVLGWGNVVPVVTQEVVTKEGPTFVATVNAVSALLTLPVMRALNEQVELHADPAAAATQFLQTHGLLPAPGS
jgi:osmoprotectant transport system substrate-binding protein